MPGTYQTKDLIAELNGLTARVGAMTDAARAHLQQLESPDI